MNGLAISLALGTAVVFFFAGAFASAGRARALLGSRAGKFESLGPETLEQAVRATYWGPPGIAFAALVGIFYGALFRVGPQLRGRMWLGVLLAVVFGIGISQGQRLILRSGIECYLQHRLNP